MRYLDLEPSPGRPQATATPGKVRLYYDLLTRAFRLRAPFREVALGSEYGAASLDSNGRVPVAQLGSGTPTGSKFLRDDGSWQAPGGGAASQLDANGTTLDVDAITDGQFLKRSGTSVTSAALGGAALLNVGTGAGDVAAGDVPAAAVTSHEDLAANPHLTHLRCHEHVARWDTTDIITPWGPTPSPVGTATAVRDSDGMWRRATSASGAGNKAAMLTNADLCEGQALVEIWFDFRTGSDLTSCAWWVGVYVGSTLPTQSATYTQEHLMLRRVAGTDTNWQVSRYQSSQTLTDTGVAAAASTHYAVRIRQAAGTWRITLYTVSGRTYTQVYDLDSLTTEIPQAASRLRHHCGLIVDSSVTRVADWKSTRMWAL